MAVTVLPLTIPAGSALSAPLQVPANLQAVRIIMPDAWDAAPITFQLSADGVSWWDLHHVAEGTTGMWSPYETGVQSVVANSGVLLPSDAGLNIGWLKFRSGSRSKPVNQSAARTFMVVFA
jgi:hypothetical protein